MRKSLAILGLALAMLLGAAGARPAQADAEMTWKVRSSYDYKVQIEFYSMDRKAAWPGNGRAYNLDDSQRHNFTLRCVAGEKICYGAWATGSKTPAWGVGPNNTLRCNDCCHICGRDNPIKDLVGRR